MPASAAITKQDDQSTGVNDLMAVFNVLKQIGASHDLARSLVSACGVGGVEGADEKADASMEQL